MTQPPAPDPFGKDLLDLVVRALSISLTTYEQSTLARLLLYADRPDVAVLTNLIERAREQAARNAIGDLVGVASPRSLVGCAVR